MLQRDRQLIPTTQRWRKWRALFPCFHKFPLQRCTTDWLHLPTTRREKVKLCKRLRSTSKTREVTQRGHGQPTITTMWWKVQEVPSGQDTTQRRPIRKERLLITFWKTALRVLGLSGDRDESWGHVSAILPAPIKELLTLEIESSCDRLYAQSRTRLFLRMR